MKKIFFCLFVFAFADASFGGYAWYSPAIRVVIEKLATAKSLNVSCPNVSLYGSFSGIIWNPPLATYNSITGKFTVENNQTFVVDNYNDLNNLGKYDAAASIEDFYSRCGEYVVDEFGLSYFIYDDNIAQFYSLYEQKNFSAVKEAFEGLNAIYTQWSESNMNATMSLGVDASEFAQMAKDMDESLAKAKDEIRNAVESARAEAEKLNSELNQVQADLTLIAEESVHQAQMRINSAVSDFNGFVNQLQAAITKGEGGVWDDSMFNIAMNELSKSEEELVDAILSLQQSSQDPTVQNAISVLGVQLSKVRGVKTQLANAIQNKNLDAAKAALSSAGGVGLLDVRRSIASVNNRLATLKSKEKVASTLVGATLSLMKEQDDYALKIGKLRTSVCAMFTTMMDNVHRINSYLGSTNSMEYLDKRLSKNGSDLADFTEDELARWLKVQMQDPLFRDDDDKNTYETIGRLGKMDKTYDNIFRFIGSTYFMMYADLEYLDRFTQTYDQGSFKKENIRGFYEDTEEVGEGTSITNWYASHITAPYNWADGSTIIVTNGKFKVANTNSIAPPSITFSSAPDSNVQFTITTNDEGVVNVQIGVYYK